MLFLAVFCGFLAEYQLEHLIEHNREKVYMRSLVEDLQKDTAGLQHSVDFWNRLGTKIDDTKPMLRGDMSIRNREKIYEMVAMLVDFDDFIYYDRTIEQLRNSGNFRLIRSNVVSDSLISYDSFIRTQLREQEATLLKFLVQILSLQNELFDSEYTQHKFKTGKGMESNADSVTLNYEIVNNKEKLFKYSNDLFVYRSGIGYLISSEKGLKEWASRLISIIKREYHIK
jgi:hypothetical protein